MMTVLHASLLCVAFGFILLAALAPLRRRLGAHWYQTGVQLAVFLILLNALIFVVIGVATIFEGASS